MLAKGNYYPGQSAEEEVLLFVRRHKFTFWWPWGVLIIVMILSWLGILIYFLVSLGTGSLAAAISARLFLVCISSYFLVILAVSLTSWMSWYFDITIVTRTHLVDINQKGFFSRRVAEQSLLRVQDVSAKMTGFWQTWLRFGTVFVETAGESPNFIMNNIPRPNIVANTILKLHDELIAKGGYEGMMGDGVGDLAYEIPKHKKKIPESASNIKELEKEMLTEAYSKPEDMGNKSTEAFSEGTPLNTRGTDILPTEAQKENFKKESEAIALSEGEEPSEEFLASQDKPLDKQDKIEPEKKEEDTNKTILPDEQKEDEEGELKEGKSIKF